MYKRELHDSVIQQDPDLMVFVTHVTPNLAGWFVNKNDIACIWLVGYFTVEIETFHSSRTVYINFSRILTVVAV